MNKVTAESCERDSAVTLFGPGDYCALTKKMNNTEISAEDSKKDLPFLLGNKQYRNM